jgi:Flp pilus assembly protein TadD
MRTISLPCLQKRYQRVPKRPRRILHLMAALWICGLAAGCLQASASALNRGADFFQSGRYREAATEYQRAIALDPSWAAPHLGLGNALDELGDLPGALNAYQKAVLLSPEWSEANTALGSVLLRSDRAIDAVGVIQEAIKLAPDDPEPKALLGTALSRLGRDAEALEAFETALKLAPGSLDAAATAAYQVSSARIASRRLTSAR